MASTQVVNEIPVLSVTQLTQAIKLSLEATFPLLSVQGEVSNFKKQGSGHLYFTLKDSQSQISAVMFRSPAGSLLKLPKEGDKVIVKGELTVYPPRGNYQLVVQELHFAGIGELLLQLEALKAKYRDLGYFASEHKKPLPSLPKRIGIVTSPTGAVIQDILHVLDRRQTSFHVILNPVKVQGDGAAEEIAQAIEQFNAFRLVDVLIVGRGGGSIEDLWAFNSPLVIEAIHRSFIPVISAVGHETDNTLSDLVADLRAPTPSAAAEIVLAETVQRWKLLEERQKLLDQSLSRLLLQTRENMRRVLKSPFFQSSEILLRIHLQRLDDMREEVDTAICQVLRNQKLVLDQVGRRLHSLKPKTQINHLKQRVESLDASLKSAIAIKIRSLKNQFSVDTYRKRSDQLALNRLAFQRDRLKRLLLALKGQDPKNLLAKGYTILFSQKTGSVITTVRDLRIGEAVRMQIADGTASATITQKYASDSE